MITLFLHAQNCHKIIRILRNGGCLMLSIIGIITILVIVALLISGRVSPIVAMVIPPVIAMYHIG